MLRNLRTRTRHFALVAPRPAPDRHGLAMGAIIRDEGRFLPEWLQFHERAGVRAFYLYDDGSGDDPERIARAALVRASVTVIPWAMRLRDAVHRKALHTQALAYAHCIANFGADYRWMAMLDPDEFCFPRQHATIPEALEGLSDCPVIALPWRMFGRNGLDHVPDSGVVANFTRAAPEFFPGEFKTIFDPARITLVHVHRMRADQRFSLANDRGGRFRCLLRAPKGALSADVLQLNHYYTRGENELAAKIAKGGDFVSRAPLEEARIRKFVHEIERLSAPESAILDYVAHRQPKV